VNSQNNKHYFAEHTMFIHQMPLLDLKVGVWCVVSAARIIASPSPLVF